MKISNNILDNGCAIGMEGGDSGCAPGLTFGPLRLGPDDRFPVWLEGKHALSNNLDAVATWLMSVEEEALSDGVFAWREFDKDAIFQVDICGPQYIFAVVEVKSDVVQTAR